MGSAVTWLTREQVHQISYRGVANLMHPSFRPAPKTHWPDREETGRANESMIAAAARRCRQRSGFMFIEQPAYPTVADSLSTEILGSSPVPWRWLTGGSQRVC